jgi:hypothetical protein
MPKAAHPADREADLRHRRGRHDPDCHRRQEVPGLFQEAVDRMAAPCRADIKGFEQRQLLGV